MTTNPTVTAAQMLAIMTNVSALPGKGPLAMMIALLAMSNRLSRTDHLLMTPKTLREFSFTRTTAYHAIKHMEEAGIVAVKRQRGCSPMVTLLLSSDQKTQNHDQGNPKRAHRHLSLSTL